MNLLPAWNASPLEKSAAPDGRPLLLKLLLLNASVRVAHWGASTKTNEHAALGGLYAAIDDAVDAWAEAQMGRAGSRDFLAQDGTVRGTGSVKELIDDVRKAAEDLMRASKSSPDLENIAADLIQAVNKTAYLLEL